MYSVIYIIPYFGKMRDDFQLWLNTCKHNPTIDWLIITDNNTSYDYPDNVKIIYRDFRWVRDKVQSIYDFKISLETPYKLCDYKPAYGEIFKEYIGDYDFWGHCDLDLLWGDIRSFLTDEILARYDKIGFLGHSTLYRNCEQNNSRYKLLIDNDINFKEAFSTQAYCLYDERTINNIYEKYNWDIYRESIYADLTEYHYNFFLTNVPNGFNHSRQIFVWSNGKLFRYYIDGEFVNKDEFMYIHFLKRKMNLKIDNNYELNTLTITPNVITNVPTIISRSFIMREGRPRWVKFFYTLFITKKDTITLKNLFKRIFRMVRKLYLLSTKNDKLNELENK